MALATQCPHCNTTFRVAADQLKLRGGIVRCGACHEVFDGNAALVDLDAVVAPDTTAHAEPIEATLPEAAQTETPPVEAPAPDTALPDSAGPGAQFDAQLAEVEAQAAANSEPVYTLDFDNTFGAFGIVPKTELDTEPEPAPEPAPAPPPLNINFTLELESPPKELLAPEPEPVSVPDPDIADIVEAAPAPEVALEAVTLPEPDMVAETARETEPAPEPVSVPDPAVAVEEELPPSELELDPELAAAAAPLPRARARSRNRKLPRAPAPVAVDVDFPPTEILHDQAGHAEIAPAVEPETAPEADHDEPDFVKRAKRAERLARSWRIGLAVASVLLFVALVLQGVTTFRNVLAARFPEFNPLLAQACATLGCTLELPTQVDTLAIETGELQTLGGENFALTTLLRNQGALTQAWPHIELVLTDATDRALLRRVIRPRDYLAASVLQAKGFAAHSEQPVKLYFAVSGVKASGYRIAVFYP